MAVTDEDRPNLLRILIATDNHLGVWEKDEIRKDDSFVTFEEIFDLAKNLDVDFVLLGGDMFHDNKPSRMTLVRTMEILSKACMSERKVDFQILSGPAAFANGAVNFEDPKLQVGLPVFTIHGNHDDPSGADNLSAVDILSTSKLVNYFGKTPSIGSSSKIRIDPVLLQKGTTKLALYGLGNIRDERLARMFQTPGAVEWVMPGEAEAVDGPLEDWFSVFVLHQNRMQHTQAAKNFIAESYLPKFLDFVVWGHEHECIVDPWETSVVGAQFNVLQPGSSVATALSEGEAKRKHAVLFEVIGEHFRTVKYPLETVRPFAFDSCALQEALELDPEDPETITRYLEDNVGRMVQEATVRAAGTQAPLPPLVRLRVDYTGFTTINSQRFGQKFVGKVANPHDMLLWTKAPVRRNKDDVTVGGPGVAALRPSELDERQIEDLVSENLHAELEVLAEPELATALHKFVEKEDRGALADCVQHALRETQARMAEMPADSAPDLDEALHAQAAQRRSALQASARERKENGALPSDGATGAPGSRAPSPGLDDMDVDAAAGPSEAPAPARQARGRASGRGSQSAATARGGGGGRQGPRQTGIQEAFARRKTTSTAAPTSSLDGVLASTQAATPGLGRAAGSQRSVRGPRASSKASPSASRQPAPRRGASTKALQKIAENKEDSDLSEDEDDAAFEADSGDEDEDEVEDADSDLDEIEDLTEEPPSVSRKRTRGGLPVAAAGRTGGAARGGGKRAAAKVVPSMASAVAAGGSGPAVGSFVVDSDDEDGGAVPVVRVGGRRRGGGGSQAAGASGQGPARNWGSGR